VFSFSLTCFLLSAQLSEQDSALVKDLRPFFSQIVQQSITDDLFLEHLDSTLALHPSSDFSKGNGHFYIGAYLEFTGKSDEALLEYTQAQNFFQDCCTHTLEYVENDIRIGFISIHAGLFNFDTLHFQKGYKYVSSGYERSRKYGFAATAQRMLDFMGDYHFYSAFQIQDFDTALAYYEQLYDELEGSPDSTYRFIDSRLNLANVHRRLENMEVSEIYFDEAIQLANKYGYHKIIYAAHNDKAQIYEEAGNYEESLRLKLIAYDHALKVSGKEILNRANRELYRTYRNLQDYEKALDYLEVHFEGVQEMNKAEALQLEAKLESQREIDGKQLQIVALENKNLVTSRNLLLAIAGLGSLILVSLFYAYRSQRRSNKELLRKNKEILLAQLRGQNIERKRMAGELHDNLNTKIAAVRYRLEAQAMKKAGDKEEMLDGTLQLVNDIYEDIRLISHNLIPETVEEIGLAASLEKLFSTLNENDGTHFHLISKFHSEDSIKPMTYELYNIIFEMVNNILKHAQAEKAWVSISQVEDNLVVTVKDDGQGFDSLKNQGGFGLRSIHSRVEKMDGVCTVDSTPGLGTKYTIEIPLS